MSTIAENLSEIKTRVARAAAKAGRSADEIEIVAVSKAVDVDQALAALEAGATDLGESRIQEARRKFESIGGQAKWHMIGPLQTNKAKYCPGLFALIHSVDRLELVRELAHRAELTGVTIDCLLQVNLSGEEQKSGCDRDEAVSLIKASGDGGLVRFCGLMTIPPYNEDPEASRPIFRELANLKIEIERLGLENCSMDKISMGMTGDFEIAIEEGATIVRIGTGIFGKRVYN